MNAPQEYDLELWQGGMMVASAHGANFNDVYREIMHYAFVYAQDGPCTVKGIPDDKWAEVKSERTIA